MSQLYQSIVKTTRSHDWLIILAVFILTVLSLWQVFDAIFPPTAIASASLDKLRSDFNHQFGADRTTVREAEHYRVVSPSPGGAP